MTSWTPRISNRHVLLFFVFSSFIAHICGALIQQRMLPTSTSLSASATSTSPSTSSSSSGFKMNVGFAILFAAIGLAVLLVLVFLSHYYILRRSRSRSSISTPIDHIKPFYLKPDIKFSVNTCGNRNLTKIRSHSVEDVNMFDLAEGVTVSKAVVSDAPALDFEAITRAASIKKTVGVGRRYSERTLQNQHSPSISTDSLPVYQPRDMDSHIPIPVYLPTTKQNKSGKSETTYVLPPMSIIKPKPKPYIINLDSPPPRPRTFHEEPILPRTLPRAHPPQNMMHKRFLSTPTLPSVKVLNFGKNGNQVHNNYAIPRAPGTMYTPSLLNPDHTRSRLSKIEERACEQESIVSANPVARMDSDAAKDEDMSQSLSNQRRQSRPRLSIITDKMTSPPPYR